MGTRTAREVLAEARAPVEKGWCRHDYAADFEGLPVHFEDAEAVLFCPRGAIYRAAGADRQAKDEAHTLLNRALGNSCIAEWNDTAGRKQEEVVALFDRAIELAEVHRMDEVIRFYGTGDPYGEFSNFAAYPIRLKGKTWPTSEHYFQAQKFAGTEHEEAIRRVASPMIAARMGRDRKRPLRPDWESVKDEVMREAVRAKFRQHAELKVLLLSTGEAELVEHTANDRYWGDGGDGSGRNMLGRVLMEVREELRKP